MIEVKNLCVKFTKEFYALSNVDIEITDGEKIALLGDVGSGKTTFLRVLTKLQSFDSGEVYIKHFNIKKIDFNTDIEMGYLPCTPVFISKKTVYENLKMHLLNKNLTDYDISEKIRTTLESFGLIKFSNQKVESLNLFQKYMLSFARLAFRNLDLLLVDNIFEKLSVAECDEILKILNNYKNKDALTLIIATSSKEIALDCRIIKFSQGSVLK